MNLAAVLLAGLLLAVSDHPLHLWPLQFLAFVAFWWGLWRRRAAGRATWRLGAAFALAYAALMLLAAGLALPILVAAAATVVQWTLAAPLAARCLDRGAVRGPLAAAATLTLVELATWHLVPMFGTAQAFVRPLSAAPWLVAFAAYTGVGGVVFAVAALPALAVSALRGPRRGAPLAALLALVVGLGALDAVRWRRPLGPPQRVAALGWDTGTPQSPDGASFVEVGAALAGEAGAALLVTPETGAWVGNRDRALAHFAAVAQRHGLTLALGVWHQPTNDNRIWFVDRGGELRAEYSKAHLVPWLEHYTRGDGAPVQVPFAGLALGGMICQDDNFTDIARGHGRAGVPIVAVPTNDWPAIREFHLENAVFRAIENGYAVVRAASGGISALVSPRGEVVRRFDHTAEPQPTDGAAQVDPPGIVRSPRLTGAALLFADLPLGDGAPTLYARLGDTPVLLLGAALVLLSLRRHRRRA
ncbi:MAG: hypothetical protein KF830_16390 [Planctomycetes bacterium]|nr:hypothetical protein [Planctomycetota bacterium]